MLAFCLVTKNYLSLIYYFNTKPAIHTARPANISFKASLNMTLAEFHRLLKFFSRIAENLRLKQFTLLFSDYYDDGELGDDYDGIDV